MSELAIILVVIVVSIVVFSVIGYMIWRYIKSRKEGEEGLITGSNNDNNRRRPLIARQESVYLPQLPDDETDEERERRLLDQRQRRLLAQQQSQWFFTQPPVIRGNPTYRLRYPNVNGLDLNFFINPELANHFNLDDFMNAYEAAREDLDSDQYPTRDMIARYIGENVRLNYLDRMIHVLVHLGVLVPRSL